MARIIGLTFATVDVAASTTAASGTIPSGARMVRVTNPTAVLAFVAVGKTASATTGHPVLPGQFQDLLVHQQTSFSVVLTSGSGTVYVTPVDFIL